MTGHCAIIVNRNDGNLGFTWRRRPLTMQMRFRIRRICQTNPVRTLRRSRTVGGAGCYSGRRLRRRSLLAWLWRCGRTWTSRQRIGFLDLKRYGKSLRKDAQTILLFDISFSNIGEITQKLKLYKILTGICCYKHVLSKNNELLAFRSNFRRVKVTDSDWQRQTV